MNNLTMNDELSVFIYDKLISPIDEFIVNWEDSRAATGILSAYLPESKEAFYSLKNGATIDVMSICRGTERKRENGLLVFSLGDIWNVTKQMKNIVATSPDKVDRLIISAEFKSTLRFNRKWYNDKT